MVDDVHAWKKKRRRLWLALALMAALLAVAVIPPMVSISRYKSRITQLMAESLGRPVHLSSVELRLLPLPGFVLTALTVEEDPAFGAEPLLRASTVTASIRLQSLWRGRLEISTVSLDDASFNLVRSAEGRWNLDPLFRTAAAKVQAPGQRAGRVMPLPYMEATNSRINFKRGAEKLPFSLVNADLSFWQEEPGDWRIRLRGQPARTDLSLDLADTGIVRLEARAQKAAELREMPVHLDLEWREAQLGQLARLVIGSDPGWRGNLTGELHLDGTANAAQIQTQLRAVGVHRAEFAPAAPMDFDASCGLLYHYSQRAVENLLCDSPLGDGHVRVSGDLPENGAPKISVELDRIPVAAGLDALRTIRSDFGPGLEAEGLVSGKISYATPDENSPAAGLPPSSKPLPKTHRGTPRSIRTHAAPQGPLTGSFIVEGLELSGEGFNTPIRVAKLILQPAEAAMADAAQVPAAQSPKAGAPIRPLSLAASPQSAALETTVALPAGAGAPLAVTAQLGLAGYQVKVHGPASFARARELARVAGMADAAALDAMAGDPITVDLNAEGPWLPPERAPFAGNPAAPPADSLSGTVTLRNANWKAGYLANHLEIAQATLHLGGGELRWDPVQFSYGPVKGTGNLTLPLRCDSSPVCAPKFQVQFDTLDAGALQAAILGAHEEGTLLSSLIARLNFSSSSPAPGWPTLEGTANADTLTVGPVTLKDASADLRIVDGEAEMTNLTGTILGGQVEGSCTLHAAGADQAKPSYEIEAQLEKLTPEAVGHLLGMDWSGRTFDAEGKVTLSGFTAEDLTSSAKGTLHFDWQHGGSAAESDAASTIPLALSRFDRWTADAEIAGGRIALKDNQVLQGARKLAVEGSVTLANPVIVTFTAPKETQARR